jgi:hypothetical protein
MVYPANGSWVRSKNVFPTTNGDGKSELETIPISGNNVHTVKNVTVPATV